MTESRDMEAPVTRRELHEALETWGGALERRIIAAMKAMFDGMEPRFAGIEARFAGIEARLGNVETGMVAMETRLINEIKGQTKGSEEELASRLVAVDEQYKDLPARVTRLEAKVFPPKKPRRRRAS